MQNSIIELKTFLILCKKNVQTDYIMDMLTTKYCDARWKKYTIEKVFYVIIKVVVTWVVVFLFLSSCTNLKLDKKKHTFLSKYSFLVI